MVHGSSLSPRILPILLLLLDIVIVPRVAIKVASAGGTDFLETFAPWPVSGVRLAHRHRVGLPLRGVSIGEGVLLDGLPIRVRALLAQVQLTVRIVVVHVLKDGLPVLRTALFIAGSLAVGPLLLNYELLARVGVYLGYLREGLLKLGLLLLVLLQSLFALVRRQLAVRGALGQAIRPCILRTDRAAFRGALRLGGWGWLVLPHVVYVALDGVLVLAALPALWRGLVVVVHRLYGRPGHHVGVGTTVGVVLLAVIGRELILVLQEGVLVALRAARSIRNVAGDVAATRSLALP